MKKFIHVSIIATALVAAALTAVPTAQAQDCEDRVTSGGWITPTADTFANFGAGGGIHQGELWGYLTFVDHSTSPPTLVSAQEVTAYCQIACVTNNGCEGRRITYTNATIRSGNTVCEGVTVMVEVVDCGEPGVADTFAICIPESGEGCLSGCFGGVLGGDDTPSGGNIQLHQPDPTCEGLIPICEDLDELCPCFLDCFVE